MAGRNNPHDVVIVGGGPVGMGLAIELGQRGVHVTVVERYPEPQQVPKGQNLTQRTLEHFHFWGCEDEIRNARTVPRGEGIGGMTAYGSLLGDYHFDWLNRALVKPYYYTANERLPQYATEAVLRRRAAEIPSIDLHYGWSGTGLDQDEEGVSVAIGEYNGTRQRTLRAAYAVGCDGSRSTVREAAGITETRSDHDRLMVLLVFRSPELHELLGRYPGKAFYKVLHPDFDGYWLFFGRVDLGTTWFFHAPVPPGTTRDNFDFRDLLHRAVGQPFGLDIDYVGFWDLRVAMADSYRAGRVFIAGDAAHSHPPYGGYGINTGFEDARNLGWKLAADLQGWGGPGLLDSYDAERRPVFASTARDFIERFIEEDRELIGNFSPDRDEEAFAAEWTRRSKGTMEVSAYEPNYEGSPVIAGCREGAAPSAHGDHQMTARAGHHLAPQVLSDGVNVYERLGDGFTLLSLGSNGNAVEAFSAAAEERGLPLDIVEDGSTTAREAYGASLVLIRPDQYVGWAGEDADADEIVTHATGG
ncbi:MAG: FAD-dependent oxidoreductase [Rhizobiaceae bacterium]|nr:FAD-dependent oxidoreductase [Rhizobiaceae bacterium]